MMIETGDDSIEADNRPTSASVTAVSCTCEYLQRAADDPDSPIVFDERMGEFQFTYHDADEILQQLMIYHCPWCGGVAPRSKRRALFHIVPRAETDRLSAIMSEVKTLDDALSLLGEPDTDSPAGSSTETYETDTAPPTFESFRTLTYRRLSDVADVMICLRGNRKDHWTLSGKALDRGR
jgi:hypothetical protein